METAMIGARGSDKTQTNRLAAIAQLLAGYVCAVATGSVVLGILLQLTSALGKLQPSDAAQLAIVLFSLGLLFAVPYTAIACLGLKRLAPSSTTAFLIVGTLCPGVTLLPILIVLGGQHLTTVITLKLLAITIPAGLISTFLFGTVGLGKWRFA